MHAGVSYKVVYRLSKSLQSLSLTLMGVCVVFLAKKATQNVNVFGCGWELLLERVFVISRLENKLTVMCCQREL